MTRNCKNWLTGRFTGILIPAERNQRMEVDFITQQAAISQKEIVFRFRKDVQSEKGGGLMSCA